MYRSVVREEGGGGGVYRSVVREEGEVGGVYRSVVREEGGRGVGGRTGGGAGRVLQTEGWGGEGWGFTEPPNTHTKVYILHTLIGPHVFIPHNKIHMHRGYPVLSSVVTHIGFLIVRFPW